jgi:hypothetical protein
VAFAFPRSCVRSTPTSRNSLGSTSVRAVFDGAHGVWNDVVFTAPHAWSRVGSFDAPVQKFPLNLSSSGFVACGVPGFHA